MVLSNFTFKILSNSDTDVIDDISHWQTMRYGYKIQPEYIKQTINACLTNEFSSAICCYDNEEPIGFNMMHRMGNFLPFWNFGFYLSKPSKYGQGILTDLQYEIISLTLDYNCKLAESEGRHDWFIAHVDSRSTNNRQLRLSKLISDRYDSYDIEKVEPGTKSKYEYINRLIGDRPFKRPLVITHRSLKNDFRIITKI